MKNWYARVFSKACIAAKVRGLHIHCTRHSFASILMMNNESIAYVSKQLGHSSIKMTVDTYGHLPGANRRAVNKLPSLTAPPPEKRPDDEKNCNQTPTKSEKEKGPDLPALTY
jgi:integrase